MRIQLTLFILFLPALILSQEDNSWKKSALVISPEIRIGKTKKSNSGFPDRKLQKQFVLSIGVDHTNNPQEWAYWLKGVRSGVSLGVTDFGNSDSLGIAISTIPYLEFNLFKAKRLKLMIGLGFSYFNEKYDPITNPDNRAVTTDLAMSFKSFFSYTLISKNKMDLRLGLGICHHSNGHTRLLNQGYNSFLLNLSADIKNPLGAQEYTSEEPRATYSRSSYSYISIIAGFGKNVLALPFNDKKNVYTISGVYGRIWDNTYKLGLGFNYRFYEHYYDYIKNDESLVNDGREFDYFKENPWRYATNFALTLNGEIILNHIGIDAQVGYNFHKPAYKIDWRINQGWVNTPREIPEYWMLGEYDTKFKLKHRISTRLGLKYYLIGNIKKPKHNIYLGCYINANLGQADFTEVSLGYRYAFGFK